MPEQQSHLIFFELLFVLAFVGGWLAVEWQAKKLDAKRDDEKSIVVDDDKSAPDKN